MSTYNRRYAKPTDGGASYEFAPDMLWPNPGAPTEAEYLSAGWFRNRIDDPTPPEGKMVSGVRYETSDGNISAVYEYGDPPPPTLDDFDIAMEEHLRRERVARGYTTREPDSYLTSSNARWKQDAEDWVAHRDAVMEYALGLINAVEDGEMAIPTMEEFTAGLPDIEWSYA